MLTRESLLFSPTRDGCPSSDDNFTAEDIVSAQEALEDEAREAIPFSFAQCSYDVGYVKQPVFACQTCLNYAGVCSACSVSCHAEHELVELFMRRDFRCDCGTARMGAGSVCSISKRDDADPNPQNKYDRAFKGSFCICGVPYDPQTETDAMYQCINCEDWLHHACLFGSHSETNSSPLSTDDFDMFICGTCVTSDPRIRRIVDRWAGVEGSGVMIINKENRVLGRRHQEKRDGADGDLEEAAEEHAGAVHETSVEAPIVENAALPISPHSSIEAVGEKRKAENLSAANSTTEQSSADDDTRAAKKAKHLTLETSPSQSSSSSTSSESLPPSSDPPASSASTTTTFASALAGAGKAGCTAPPEAENGKSILAQLEKDGVRMNVYLEEGFYDRWCRCGNCMNQFISFPFLLEEEETFEPPEDPDAHKSTMELGLEALERMPRGQSIDGLAAFRGLGDRLKPYLQSIASSGRSVTKEDIDQFFMAEAERRRAQLE